jgi:hypothetical protein
MGLLNPANLLYALSIAALIAIYLRARSRPTIEVSSLIIFEEAPAPVANSRVLRLDLPFWLEALALGALSLALAGLYFRVYGVAGGHRTHALVFDLGAAMNARGDGGTAFDAARAAARRVIAKAPEGDSFAIITYALAAGAAGAPTADRAALNRILDGLKPTDVAANPAALRAALVDARAADTIDLFANRPAPPVIVEDADLSAPPRFHRAAAPAANLAIVSLDPGVPRSSLGRALIRNFSYHPQTCELEITAGGRTVFHSGFIVEPRAELVVPFGPVHDGGLVEARILTRDGLAADNVRYALAPSIAQMRALVLSPDPGVRDDLARILLAINPNFLVTAADPNLANAFDRRQHFALAMLHDCSGAGVAADARLYIFPEPPLIGDKRPPLLPVAGSVAAAEMRRRAGVGELATPVLLGPARIVRLPGWMEATSEGGGAGGRDEFALTAAGRAREGEVGMIAFDVRHHLLLDPDRLDALLAAIGTIRRLIAPPDVMIEPTGAIVTTPVFARATLVAPDGSRRMLTPDRWGRVRFQPLLAGRYTLAGGGQTISIYANYYDAGESDLSGAAAPAAAAVSSPPHAARAPAGARHLQARTIGTLLAAIALLLFMLESIVLARRAARWSARHV